MKIQCFNILCFKGLYWHSQSSFDALPSDYHKYLKMNLARLTLAEYLSYSQRLAPKLAS